MNKQQLTELFSTDEELLSMYHILAPNTAEICAERTLKDLKGSYVYSFEQDNEIIGYYGIDGKSLTGFFIKPENRNKETITKFWNEIESNFTNDYYCGLYTKNTRAIEFIRKKSTEEYPVQIYDGIFFKIKRN